MKKVANCLMRFAYQAYNIKHNLFCRSDKVLYATSGSRCNMPDATLTRDRPTGQCQTRSRIRRLRRIRQKPFLTERVWVREKPTLLG